MKIRPLPGLMVRTLAFQSKGRRFESIRGPQKLKPSVNDGCIWACFGEQGHSPKVHGNAKSRTSALWTSDSQMEPEDTPKGKRVTRMRTSGVCGSYGGLGEYVVPRECVNRVTRSGRFERDRRFDQTERCPRPRMGPSSSDRGS